MPGCSVGIVIPGCHAGAEMIHCPSIILLCLTSSLADECSLQCWTHPTSGFQGPMLTHCFNWQWCCASDLSSGCIYSLVMKSIAAVFFSLHMWIYRKPNYLNQTKSLISPDRNYSSHSVLIILYFYVASLLFFLNYCALLSFILLVLFTFLFKMPEMVYWKKCTCMVANFNRNENKVAHILLNIPLITLHHPT